MKNKFIFLSAFILLLYSCAFQPITKSKNIIYSTENKLALNIFSPKNITTPHDVFVFIHGGNWRTGHKSLYNFFGKRMARKGIVTVIIDYRLSPLTDYQGMAMDAAKAIKWTKENISSYGGDPDKLFVSGHSAGGHLAALISTDNHYFDELKIKNPLKGTILIDAFGLDMYSYLNSSENKWNKIYVPIFTADPENWKAGSPIYHLNNKMPEFLLFTGSKTYPWIIRGSNDFLFALQKYQPETQLISVKGRRHVGMIFSFFNPHKKAYGEIIEFIKNVK